MEPEFDKIIDALLRSSPKDGGDLGASAVHFDADEISAFAENALPQAARSNYVTHFADCGRCRNLLANVIAMNAEDAPATAKAAAVSAPLSIAGAAEPWYRWLFKTPNLAAAMGVLVLVFSGFIGYIALRDSTQESATISQVREDAPAASGPNAGEEPFYSADLPVLNANASANSNAANIGGGGGGREETMTMSNSANAAANIAPPKPVAYSTDGVAKGETLRMAPAAAPPAPPPPVETKAKEAREAQLAERSADVAISAESLNQNQNQNQTQTQIQNQTLPNARSGPVQAAPSRDSSLGGAAKKRAATPLTVRQAGGKTFDLRDGVWYDRAYSSQTTTNVRRGSEAYRKLDGGLRSIAESIPGVVVIAWKQTAYRIQ